MSKFNVLSVALAAALAPWPQLAQAQVVTGQAQLTNFSVKLTDLNKFDFTSPSLKLIDADTSVVLAGDARLSGTYLTSIQDQRTSTLGAGSLLDTTKLQDQLALTSGLLQSSKDGGNLSAQVTADAATFSNVPFGFYRTVPQGASLLSTATATSQWTLSRNTDAVFTGTLLLQANANANTLADRAWNPVGIKASGSASFQLTMFALRGDSDASEVFDGGEPVNLYESIGFSDVVVADGSSLGTSGTNLLERTFSIHVRNASNQALTVGFTGLMSAYGSVLPTRTLVPEPGTWALMGLGLGLMAWRVRTGRRA
ncbi:PEP-CTERM sorting domain-containing protein [Aquabacterium sp. CECT 9606]|uniref:PEP-CTERM sorting domain-containing protein n=1 Tax=Aquabacterium sp. CECT 9606 TaxID=2845822 RepID=UPI001E4AD27E|nr:PEP-CTERM sorting domain-containing protein [Aquabacterium sp. CECT 9606]CAH0350744.1 hypothetical protein AQB9606_01670 [Aquabacterium sp. CECT 9606]